MASLNHIHRYNFSLWLYNELKIGRQSFITYLPFIPFIGSLVQHKLDHIGLDGLANLEHDKVFQYSILAQVIIIFFILIYQLYEFSKPDKNNLSKSIRDLFTKAEDENGKIPEPVYRFVNLENANNKQERLKEGFEAALRNISYFKMAWIALWVTWFCYYIALYVKADSSSLFSFFIIIETLCFALCYFLLSYQIFESKGNGQNYWWVVVIIALVFALAIVDQSTDNNEIKMFTSALKTLMGCVFLGLLVGSMTKQVQQAPNWVKVTLFFYVAIQPMLFAVISVPELTGNHIQQTEMRILPVKPDTTMLRVQKTDPKDSSYAYKSKFKKDTTIVVSKSSNTSAISIQLSEFVKSVMHSFNVMSISLFNVSLILKYLLMFYFIWLLRYDHLLVYYMRTQHLNASLKGRRENFEHEIKSYLKKVDLPTPTAPTQPTDGKPQLQNIENN